MVKIKQILFIFFGSLFVLFGIIGLLLPVVPTTPFLIIAGIFYIRSSDKLYNKLIHTKIFGPHIKNYVEERKVTSRFKLYSLLLLWIPTLITEIFIVKNWYIRIIPIVIAILITIHILSLTTILEMEINDNKIDD